MNRTLALNQSVLVKCSLSLNRKIVALAGFCFVAALFSAYIFQVNALTQERYLTHEHERKLGQLTQENKFLEVNFSMVGSLVNMDAYLQGHTFQKAGKIEYIRVLDSSAMID